jgi:nickel/cobalt transporter (NicO) family protein
MKPQSVQACRKKVCRTRDSLAAGTMNELFYLVSSFWLGALHAATPGHGKTIAAAYIVGARGRPVDALVLGIFVTLSHTSGIVLVAVLATLGSAWLLPQRVEAYVAVATGLLVIGMGVWLLWTQPPGLRAQPRRPHEHGHDDATAPHHHGDAGGYHRHGWGPTHTHDVGFESGHRPSLAILLGLGVAGGLLPDPGALAILLAALASGKVMLGLFTVLVFSLGFASVLVVVGIAAAIVGDLALRWLDSRWMGRLQVATAVLIVLIGLVLTVSAARTLKAVA